MTKSAEERTNLDRLLEIITLVTKEAGFEVKSELEGTTFLKEFEKAASYLRRIHINAILCAAIIERDTEQ